MPTGVEVEEVPLDRILAHGAKRRGIDAMRRLGAPPHYPVVWIGTAKAAAEKSALPERRIHALSDRGILDQRPRQKAAKPDQAGIERRGTIGNDMPAHRRMHAVRADQKVAFGAGAIGEVRDDWLIRSIFDADQPFLEGELDILAPALFTIASLSVARHMFTAG